MNKRTFKRVLAILCVASMVGLIGLPGLENITVAANSEDITNVITNIQDLREEGYDYWTLSDVGAEGETLKAGYNKDNTCNKSIAGPQTSMDKTVFSAKIKFPEKDMIGGSWNIDIGDGRGDGQWHRFVFESNGANYVKFRYFNYDKPTFSKTLTPSEAGVALRGNENLTLSLSVAFEAPTNGDDTYTNLKVGVFFNGKLYNNEYFTVENVQKTWAVWNEVSFCNNPNIKGTTMKFDSNYPWERDETVLKEQGYDYWTLSDVGTEGGTLNAGNQTDTSCNQSVTGPATSMDKTVFSAKVKFPEATDISLGGWWNIDIGDGRGDNQWHRFVFESSGVGADDVSFKYVDYQTAMLSRVLTPSEAGVTLRGNENLTVSISVAFETPTNGETDYTNLKVGLYFNGKLYNNEYFTVENVKTAWAVWNEVCFYNQYNNQGTTMKFESNYLWDRSGQDLKAQGYDYWTLSDVGVEGGTLNAGNQTDTSCNKSITGSTTTMDKTVLSAKIKFPETTDASLGGWWNIDIGDGRGDNLWHRFVFESSGVGADDVSFKYVDYQTAMLSRVLTPSEAGVTLRGNENLTVSLSVAFEAATNGEADYTNLKVGLYFNGKLYNNEYFTVENVQTAWAVWNEVYLSNQYNTQGTTMKFDSNHLWEVRHQEKNLTYGGYLLQGGTSYKVTKLGEKETMTYGEGTVLTEPGEYKVLIPDASYDESVVLYKPADVNSDGELSVVDLVASKKMQQGIAPNCVAQKAARLAVNLNNVDQISDDEINYVRKLLVSKNSENLYINEYVAKWVNGGFENGKYTVKPTFCRINKFSLLFGGVISVDTGDQYIQIWEQETLEDVTSTQVQVTNGWFQGKCDFEVPAGNYAIAVIDSTDPATRGNITADMVEVTVNITEYLTEQADNMITGSISYPDTLPTKIQQGMSIYDGNAYCLTDRGGCVIYNLESKKIIGSYTLPNSAQSHHCNSASFAGTLDGEPLLYVSECYGAHGCFVYKMGLESAELVQTITFNNANGDYTNSTYSNACDWIVDYDSQQIMTYGLLSDGNHKIKVFDLPSTTEATVTLTENDVTDQWVVEDFMDGNKIVLYQGNCVYGDKIFLADSTKNVTHGYVYVFDKNTHKLVSATCYSDINEELEDCCVYDGKLYTITAGGMIHCFDIEPTYEFDMEQTHEYVAEWVNGGFGSGVYNNDSKFCRVNKFSLPFGGVISVDTGKQYIQIWEQETLENVNSTQNQVTSGWFIGKCDFEVPAGNYAIALVDVATGTRPNITAEDVKATVNITEYLTEQANNKITGLISYPSGLPTTTQQGMAIYDGNAYCLTRNGGCVIYNLESKKIMGSYTLPNATEGHECNSASFAGTLDGAPLLYVSECYGENSCFVYKMEMESATLVQTITFDNTAGEYTNSANKNACDWIVDADSKQIMTYGLLSNGKKKIKVFNLPVTTEATVTLAEGQVIDQWVVEDYMNGGSITTYQGNCVYGDTIFLADSTSYAHGGYIYAFDKNTHELVSAKCYSAIINNPLSEQKQLADCCVYDGKLYTIAAGGRIHCFDID